MRNIKNFGIFTFVALAVFGIASIIYVQHASRKAASNSMPEKEKSHAECPMMKGENGKTAQNETKNHDNHLAMVNERGEKAMGFSQTETTHHFLLMKDGGAIQVEVNDAKDKANLEQIRKHLAFIAKAFTGGDFDTPLAVHDRIPPGATEMKRLRESIKYEYQETERGGRVRITTDNAEALAAIHEFLRFQITDHQTGDSLEVKN